MHIFFKDVTCPVFTDGLMSASYENIECIETDLGDGVGCGGGAEACGVGQCGGDRCSPDLSLGGQNLDKTLRGYVIAPLTRH